MKKIILTTATVIVIILAALTAATIGYTRSSDYTSDSLPDNTTVNGIDCSGMDYAEATDKLSEAWNSRTIIISGNLNEELARFTDFGFTYDIDAPVKDIKKDNLILAAANHYFKTPLSVSIPMIVSDFSFEFKQAVTSSDFLHRGTATVSRDAYVDLEDPDFPIIPEVYGTSSDTEKFFNRLIHHIQLGDIRFIFDERDYYTMPEVTADDEDLIDYQKYCRKYLKQKITYKLGNESFTISAEQLDKLLADDHSGKAEEEAVAGYVKELAAKYDNVGGKREFTSLTGYKVTVEGGTYGWMIDQEKETKKLINDINSHKNVTRKPVYSAEGYGEYSRDMGNTYIDVDITRQTVTYFKNGEQKFTSKCVTGCQATGTTTDIGAYYILNKVTDVVLRGDNGDGTEYESPVKYWLGVTWTGEGFHDADWRNKFGGDIWKRNGSHGCINMPPKVMPEFYRMIDVGIPVVNHY
ncbi:MAG: L,D-transpeptidase family protein [Bacillota bacterium]|nr:L,D-transpeptidase family protein [Bacillota bacterium]